MFSAGRMSPRWVILAASTSSTFLFCPPRSLTPTFILPDCGKAINGALGAVRGWNISPSRTSLIPICTSLPSSSTNKLAYLLFREVVYCGLVLRIYRLIRSPMGNSELSQVTITTHESPVTSHQSLPHVRLGNLPRIHQMQRQVYCLSRAQCNVLLPL